MKHGQGIVPADAGIRDALAVFELGRVVLAGAGRECAGVKVAFHHHAECAPALDRRDARWLPLSARRDEFERLSRPERTARLHKIGHIGAAASTELWSLTDPANAHGLTSVELGQAGRATQQIEVGVALLRASSNASLGEIHTRNRRAHLLAARRRAWTREPGR